MHNASHPEYKQDQADAVIPGHSGTELGSLTGPLATNALTAMHEAKQKVPGDVVNKATSDLPDNQRKAIRRLHSYYIEKDMTLDEAAALIDMAGPSLSLVFHGRYPSKLDHTVARIEKFFALEDKRGEARKLHFIHNSLSKRIWGVCSAALEFQKVAFIFGDQQIGKTESLIAYRDAHNHGNTVYTSVPAGGGLIDFLIECATRLRISPHQRIAILRRRIKDSFDDRMVLIVDELHHTVDDQARPKSIQTVEFIREIFDEKHCGLVCCATNVFRDAMEDGACHKLFRQIKRRRLCSLQLPNTPTREDLNTFAAAYGLPPSKDDARKLEAHMIETEALGMWLTLLRMGAKIASQRHQPFAWPHVLSAHLGLQQLEGTAPK